MPLIRWIVGMPMAAAITAGLFFMMAQLIKDRHEPLPDAKPSLNLKITPQKTDTDPHEIKPPVDKLKKKPPETKLDFPPLDRAPGPIVKPDPVTIERRPPADQGQMMGPVVHIAPPYPQSFLSRGLEGVVIVEFDVTPRGDVVNPRVISTPHGCFKRTVIKAVSGWKYPPAANGGMRYGVIERFNFQLED